MYIQASTLWHNVEIVLFLLLYTSELYLAKPSEFLLDHTCKTPDDFGWNWERYTESMTQSIDVITTGETIEIEDSVKLYLARNPLMYKSDQEYLCKIAFIVKQKDTRLLLTWKNFNVGSTRQGKDWFHVIDYDSSLDLSGPLWGVQGQALHGLRPPTTGDYHSIGQGFTLMYKGHPHDDSIVIILTAFKNIDQDGDENCKGDDYLCTGQYPICISQSLRCDGEDNCGVSNLSDERRGCYDRGTTKQGVVEKAAAGTPVGLIGALTGIAITIVIVSIVGICIRTYKKRRRQQPIMGVAELSMINTGYSRVNPENEYTTSPQKPHTGASPGSQQRWNRNNFAYPRETISTSNNRHSQIENNRNSDIENSSRHYATIDSRRPLSMIGANGYSESASNNANLLNESLGRKNGRIHTDSSPYASTDIVHSIPDSATGATAAAGNSKNPDVEYLNTMSKDSKGEPEYLNTLHRIAKEPNQRNTSPPKIPPRSNSQPQQLHGDIYYDLDDICNEYAAVK